MHTDAQSYERFMGRWSRLVAPLLVDFADVPESGWILDVGSGTGSLASTIAERKSRCYVMAIDQSNQYIAHANSTSPFPSRASFQFGDAQQLPFPNATFDGSLSLLAFNFIPDAARALREIIRVTKSRGRVSAAVWDYGGGMHMLRRFWDAAVSVDASAAKLDEKHMPLCRADELTELWRRSGLEDVREQPLDITMRFDSFPDYWEPFLLGQGPAGAYLQTIDVDKLQVLGDELKRRVAQSENTPFTLPARAWAVRGTVPDR